MGTSHHRRRRALGAAVVLAAGAVGIGVVPAPAGAENIDIEGPPPPEVVAHYADICPRPERFSVQPIYCLTVRAYDGEIKLGDTVAAVPGPIEITVGIAVKEDESGNLVPEIVSGGPGSGRVTSSAAAGGGGGVAPVEIAGGILGMPELDAVIDLAPQLLGVSATPIVGSPGPAPAPGTDPSGAALAFLTWIGSPIVQDIAINLPLSIKVNNLLLGNRCTIPEIDINLTTGTTIPPPGIEPMTGDIGQHHRTSYFSAPFTSDDIHQRVGARLVDNAFAVGGAAKCDLLVGDLLDQPSGLFDGLINGQTGLPSPAGNNHAAFSVDTELIAYPMLLPRLVGTGGGSFGTVAPGNVSEPKVVTFTHTGLSPAYDLQLGTTTLGGTQAGSFQIVDDQCSGITLSQGGQCTVSVVFAPTSSPPISHRTNVMVGPAFVVLSGISRV